MKRISTLLSIVVFVCGFSYADYAQTDPSTDNLATDNLTPAFHAERRQALRALMPPHSVVVIFSYPEEVFSRDVDYVYHPNPDLYYFSGYKEPNSVLFIFKDVQPDGDSSYNELFFVQHRDPSAEQWTGKRLGVEGVKASLGFKRVYNGEDLQNFPIDLKKYTVIYDYLSDTLGDFSAGSLKSLVSGVIKNAGLVKTDEALNALLFRIYMRANKDNLPRFITMIKSHLNSEAFKKNVWIKALLANPDSTTLADFKKNYSGIVAGPIAFNNYTGEMMGHQNTWKKSN